MNEPSIEVQHLIRHYGHKPALAGVDLAIGPNSIAALIGPNGAGKTTLLHLLVGLLEPTEGSVRLLGRSPRPLASAVAPLVQVVGDRHEPPGYARLRDLVDLQHAACPKFDRRLCGRLIADHNLSLSSRFGTLSKGQRRWTLAALALASNPRVLILDEPADGLDPSARRMLYEHLRQYVNDTGATVLVASHVLSDLERVADEVVVLRAGRVVLHDSLESIREQTRELVLHRGDASPDWLTHFQILAEQDDGVQRKQWIRSHGNEANREHALSLADTHTGVHHVNLESLYFALTEAEPPPYDPEITATEVMPCS
jgi:ABC-2 type transport system ATP-binding protein